MAQNLRRRISSPAALFVFEAAARLKNFHRAALELNVTQPSVSYQIRNLEKHLRTKLFRRSGRNVELTDAGETFHQALSSAFQTIEESLSQIEQEQRKNLVTICISAPFASYFLMPNLPDLRSRLPGIDLSLKIVSRDTNPVAENAHFSVLLGDGEWAEYQSWKLYDEVVFPLCSPRHVASEALPIAAERLLARDLLHLHERYRQRMGWKEFFEHVLEDEVEIEEHLSFSDQQPLMEAAIDGHGFALGWLGTTDNLVERQALIRPTELEVRTEQAFYLVAPRSLELSKAALDFKQWLLDISEPARQRGESAAGLPGRVAVGAG